MVLHPNRVKNASEAMERIKRNMCMTCGMCEADESGKRPIRKCGIKKDMNEVVEFIKFVKEKLK